MAENTGGINELMDQFVRQWSKQYFSVFRCERIGTLVKRWNGKFLSLARLPFRHARARPEHASGEPKAQVGTTPSAVSGPQFDSTAEERGRPRPRRHSRRGSLEGTSCPHSVPVRMMVTVFRCSSVSDPRATAGTRPSLDRCEPAKHRRRAPGDSRSFL